jgi:hypothetical protein
MYSANKIFSGVRGTGLKTIPYVLNLQLEIDFLKMQKSKRQIKVPKIKCLYCSFYIILYYIITLLLILYYITLLLENRDLFKNNNIS